MCIYVSPALISGTYYTSSTSDIFGNYCTSSTSDISGSYYTSSTADISGSYYTSVITHQLLHLQRLNPSIHQKPDAGPVCEASETDTHTERTDRLTHRHPSHSQPSPSPPRFSTQPGSSGFRCPRPANCAETNCHGIRTPTKQRQDRNVPADTSRLLTNRLQRIV